MNDDSFKELDFEFAFSYNAFIKNNLILRNEGIIGDWVDWIQLGQPTKTQIKYFKSTLANFRMLHNGGVYLTCGVMELNTKYDPSDEEDSPVTLRSWSGKYLDETNSKLTDTDNSPYFTKVSIITVPILLRIGEMVLRAGGYEDRVVPSLDTYSPDLADSISRIEDVYTKDISLQSRFWKHEEGLDNFQIPIPEIDRSNLIPEQILNDKYVSTVNGPEEVEEVK